MNAKIKIWFGFCLFFSIYNLWLLIDEFYTTNYMIVEQTDESYDNQTKFFVCIRFEEIKSKNELKIETGNVSIESFLRHSLASIEDKIKFNATFNLNQSYILSEKVCFPFEKEDLDEEYFGEFLKTYETYFSFHSEGKQPFSYEYLYKKFDYSQKTVRFKIYKQKIFAENYLDSNCASFKDQIEKSRFRCLDSCHKKTGKSRSFFYFFNNENRSLNLNLIFDKKNALPEVTQKTIEDEDDEYEYGNEDSCKNEDKNEEVNLIGNSKYESCFEQCPNKDCFLETFNTVVIKTSNDSIDKNEGKILIETIIYKAFYSTSYFYLQLIGLLTLFTGTSLIVTIPALVSMLAAKLYLKYNRYFARFFPKFKFTLITFSFILFFNQSWIMYEEYQFKFEYPNKTKILDFTFDIDPFSLILCLPVENLIYNDSVIIENRNAEILSNYSFKEIEEKSSNCCEDKAGFNLSLAYGGKLESFDWTTSKEIIFKNKTIENKKVLMRCFRIEFEIKKMRYQSLIPICGLYFFLQNLNREIYLIDRNQTFTSNLVEIKGDYFIGKYIEYQFSESNKSNCLNYTEKASCKSKRNCIDRCINEEFFKRYNSITIQSVINGDQFEPYEMAYAKFNESNDRNIEANCVKKYENEDCTQSYYDETIKTSYFDSKDKVLINLYFDKSIKREIEQSHIKLILNILNLESILFGSNATSFLLTLFYSLKKCFKLKWHKIYRVIIFMICLIGFVIHNYFIIVEIIRGKYVESGYFEKTKDFKMPNVIFCLRYPENSEDINHKLTGNYLDELTRNLTYEKVFEKLKYFNKTHWKTFKPTERNRSRDSEIKVSHFYFLGFKCLEIDLKKEFNEEDFYFTKEKTTLSVFFNEKFKEDYKSILFLYRLSDSKEFSNAYLFKIGTNLSDSNLVYLKYQITFEHFVMITDDKFETLKDPKSLIFEKERTYDVSNYLEQIKKKFENKFNLTTKAIPLENWQDIDYEIDDELFEQYYLQVQNISDINRSSNYIRRFYNIYSQIVTPIKKDNSNGDFMYSFSFVTRKTEFTNDDNYTKLIQSFLNTLSLWLNIGILDIHIYLYKLPDPIKGFYKFLIFIKEYLEVLQNDF